MVLGCKHLWIILQELWSIFYVICGSLQLLSAIFSLITLKELKLYGVLMAGGWNILMGIISGMWSCIGKYSYKTREFLLYVAISNLIINTIAIIYTEWNLYFMDIKLISNYYSNHLLIDYAIFIARIASFTALTVAFFDTQFGFCSTQTFSKRILKRETHHHHHDGSSNSMENMSDIEYIINRSNSVKSRSNREIYDAYAQSWVFDNSANNNPPNNIVRKPKSSPTTKNPLGRTSSSSSNENNLIIINKDEVDNNYLLENKNKLPMVNIKVEEQEEEEDEDTDRKIIHMKSFSRSASPIIKNYEYLEKITEPEIYRSRLNSALSSINNNSKIITTANNNAEEIVKRKIEEPVQYATLMKELQNVIVHKKVQSPESEIISTDDDDDDTEFSKELEAALQLIQDLESPNNAEIPSSDPSANNNQINPLKIRNNNNNNNSLSASSSITDIMIPSSSSSKADFYHGKKKDSARILESQSTSGYSSPSHYNPNNNLNNWSTTSSLNGASRSSNNDILKSLSYHIHDAKSTTVISLYSPPIDQNSKGKSVTLVNISANNNNNPLLLLIDDDSSDHHHHLNHDYYSQSCEDLLMKNSTTTTPPTSWNNVKSLLRKKRIINNKPVKLCAELEGAIIKSESLAYLTDLELMARAKRNEEIQREIEEKIIQNMDRRRRRISLFEAESHC